jgi:hypothetical protein
MKEYCFMTDNEGLWFLIPSSKRNLFLATLNYDYDNFDEEFGVYMIEDISEYNFKYPMKDGED